MKSFGIFPSIALGLSGSILCFLGVQREPVQATQSRELWVEVDSTLLQRSLKQGESYELPFVFRNQTSDPISIKEVSTDCWCSDPSFSRLPIEANGTSVGSIVLSTMGRRGYFKRKCMVEYERNSRSGSVVFSFEGTVFPKFDFHPKAVVFNPTGTSSQEVQFSNIQDPSFSLKLVSSAAHCVEATVLNAGSATRVRLSFDHRKYVPSLKSTMIVFETGIDTEPQLRIPVWFR